MTMSLDYMVIPPEEYQRLKTLDDNVKREIKEKQSIYEAMIKYEPMRIKHIKETLWEIEYLESLYKTK
jgi:hypothetical protein